MAGAAARAPHHTYGRTRSFIGGGRGGAIAIRRRRTDTDGLPRCEGCFLFCTAPTKTTVLLWEMCGG